MKRFHLVILLSVLLSAVFVFPVMAAAPDGNVEWTGASHVLWQDLDPLCPVDGETFTVRFQAYRNDLTSAQVVVDGTTTINASLSGVRGPYDLWTAQIPSTQASTLFYYIELTDGTDMDFLSVNGLTTTTPTDGGFGLDFSTLAHAPVGATPLPGGGTVFKVWSPSRTTAHVRGEFNSWGTADPMTKVDEYFVGRVAAAVPGQMYKYFFEGAHWNTDARAKSLNPSDNYNAHIVDPLSYAWQVNDFVVPPFEEMVIYQLHVGTFAGRNDPFGTAPFPAGYLDVAARVSHLVDLGVNAVLLNPITEFPGDLSAGYNPVTQWAPEWKYGSTDDLKFMVDSFHANGIAVLLDIVWNHFSFTDNFLWSYDGTQIYYDDPVVTTPWGDQADFDREGVRDYFAESAVYWLEEFRMDGFRMDATWAMNIAPQEASGWSLMQRLNDEMDLRSIDKISIAEQLPDNAWVTRPTSLNGAGFDAQYHDEFTDRLRDEIFDAAAGNPEMWKITNIINGSGEYMTGHQVLNYLELHDEAWPSSGGQRIVKTIDTTAPHDDEWAKGRVKLAQGLVMTAPGIPAILQGTEWLEDTDFGTDPGNRIDWSKKTTYAGIYDYFKDLITLRKTSPALRADAGVDVFHSNETGNVVAFQRYDLDGHVHVVVANFSNADYSSYRIGLPQAGIWSETLNSQSAEYEGNGLTNPGDLTTDATAADGFDQSAEITIPRMGLIVLTRETVTAINDQPEDMTPSVQMVEAFPNPFNPQVTIAFEVQRPGVVKISVYDVSGQRVRVLAYERFEAGRRSVVWNGVDDAGGDVASGVYFMRLETADATMTRKAVLVR